MRERKSISWVVEGLAQLGLGSLEQWVGRGVARAATGLLTVGSGTGCAPWLAGPPRVGGTS